MADISIPQNREYYRIAIRVEGVGYPMYRDCVSAENLNDTMDSIVMNPQYTVTGVEHIRVTVSVANFDPDEIPALLKSLED